MLNENFRKPYQVCCIGHITRDKVITPHAMAEMPGGTAYYFSHALAHLDISYLLVTAIGNDDRAAVASLQHRGIAVKQLPGTHTVCFENSYGNNPDERTQRVLQVADPFGPAQLADVEAEVFHLGALLAGDIPAEVIRILAAKGKVSVDVQGYLRKVEAERVITIDWEEKKSLLPCIHYLKANEEELLVLTGSLDVKEGARKLAEWGVKEVIVTLGSKGSLVHGGGEWFTIPAFTPSAIVDATGCGDTYMAGYLYKRVKGAGIQEAGEFAARMAAAKIGVMGPFQG